MLLGLVLALHAVVVDTTPKVLVVDTIPRGWVADQKSLDTRTSVARVEEMFEGRFPGVRVLQHSGGFSIQVRGVTTLTGSTSPLYLIDGIAVDPGPNGLITLNPSDIARIEVLKDETSLAFYGGSRAGNGVVLITTKRGGR